MSEDYPPLPWRLRGRMLLSLSPVPLEVARAVLPDGVKPVPTLPGATVGGIALGRYHRGSTLVYSELIVVAALARAGPRVGFWISHIYVDDLESLQGGREMFGLPKELARFDWDERPDGSGAVTVVRDDETLLSAGWSPPWPISVPVPLYVPCLGDGRYFSALGKAHLGPGRLRVQIPPTSPFQDRRVDRAWLTLRADHLDLSFPEVQRLGGEGPVRPRP